MLLTGCFVHAVTWIGRPGERAQVNSRVFGPAIDYGPQRALSTRPLLGLILAFKLRVTKCSCESDSSFYGKIKVVAAVLAARCAGSAEPVEISY